MIDRLYEATPPSKGRKRRRMAPSIPSERIGDESKILPGAKLMFSQGGSGSFRGTIFRSSLAKHPPSALTIAASYQKILDHIIATPALKKL